MWLTIMPELGNMYVAVTVPATFPQDGHADYKPHQSITGSSTSLCDVENMHANSTCCRDDYWPNAAVSCSALR